LFNDAGKRLLSLGTDAHGGALALSGNNGNRQGILDCHDKWGGGLFLNTPQDKQMIYMGADSNNGEGLFKLYSSDGTHSVEVFVETGGVGTVKTYIDDGQAIR